MMTIRQLLVFFHQQESKHTQRPTSHLIPHTPFDLDLNHSLKHRVLLTVLLNFVTLGLDAFTEHSQAVETRLVDLARLALRAKVAIAAGQVTDDAIHARVAFTRCFLFQLKLLLKVLPNVQLLLHV